MAQDFEINVDLTIEDYLNYQREIVLSNKNPSIVDSIKRWIRLCFMLIVIIYPWFVYLFTQSYLMTFIMFGLAVIIFILLKKNDRNMYWKFYRPKAKKDLLATYFDYNTAHTVQVRASFYETSLIIDSKNKSKTIEKAEIDLVNVRENYLFFYTKTHDGSIIPLKGLAAEEKDAVLRWFN